MWGGAIALGYYLYNRSKKDSGTTNGNGASSVTGAQYIFVEDRARAKGF